MERMLKVAYFDEESATDFINIIDGGENTYIINKNSENEQSAKINLISKIKGTLRAFGVGELSAGIEGQSNFDFKNTTLVQSSIRNTILTDFIEKAEKNNNIIKEFTNFHLKVIQDSFAYMKLYTPYTNMISEKSELNKDINIKNLDENIEKIKGYYEFVAINTTSEKYIFRFNINWLRNSYKLTDLMTMNLKFYGIEVGEITEESLLPENQITGKNSIIEKTADELLGYESGINEKNIKMYDIVLAGVVSNEE